MQRVEKALLNISRMLCTNVKIDGRRNVLRGSQSENCLAVLAFTTLGMLFPELSGLKDGARIGCQ
ncbi:hypothetical protein D918_02465 [Trichuris suis]|nr:hypothetical protein D918_02465 [Trichuris suis]